MNIKDLKTTIKEFEVLRDKLIDFGIFGFFPEKGSTNAFHTDARLLVNLAKDNNFKEVIINRNSSEYPIEISIPELKMFAICTEERLKELVDEQKEVK